MLTLHLFLVSLADRHCVFSHTARERQSFKHYVAEYVLDANLLPLDVCVCAGESDHALHVINV